MAHDPDDPRLDGCAVDFDNVATNTADDQLDALVLFADVDWTDPAAVVRREREWLELGASS